MIFPPSALVKYFLRRLAFASHGSDITTAGNSREGERKEEGKKRGRKRERERDGLCEKEKGRRKKSERDSRGGLSEQSEQSKRTGRLFMATILQIYELVPVESSGRRVFPVQNV